MDGNTIKITCTGAVTVPLEELADLQGNLKDLTEDNYTKLRNSIFEYGFSFPVFFWQDEHGVKWLLDANQRKRVLLRMRDEGFIIPELPANPIHATSKEDAKKRLLLLNSRYGHMTQEGFDEFIADVQFGNIADLLDIPDVMFEGQSVQDFADKNKEVDIKELAKNLNIECPKCGFAFSGDTSKIELIDPLNLNTTPNIQDEQPQI